MAILIRTVCAMCGIEMLCKVYKEKAVYRLTKQKNKSLNQKPISLATKPHEDRVVGLTKILR